MNDVIRNYFEGRRLVVATMHGKETIIGPILRDALGVEILVPSNFNTDIYGTFSGEIERTVDPVEAGRIKCIAACELTGCDLAIASEGSFGPHPSMLFLPGDDEILVFVDLQNKLEIKVRKISSITNFGGDLFTEWTSARKFAEASFFPSHSLIIRKAKNNNEHTIKGIASWDELQENFELFIGKYGAAFLETDMRAMCNPARQKVIEEVTLKLVQTIANSCPKCQVPGFDIKLARAGLPCSQCGSPTRSTYSFVYECLHCEHRSEVKYPNGRENEDPMFCDYCNP
jgi:hypothetical protein